MGSEPSGNTALLPRTESTRSGASAKILKTRSSTRNMDTSTRIQTPTIREDGLGPLLPLWVFFSVAANIFLAVALVIMCINAHRHHTNIKYIHPNANVEYAFRELKPLYGLWGETNMLLRHTIASTSSSSTVGHEKSLKSNTLSSSGSIQTAEKALDMLTNKLTECVDKFTTALEK